MSDSSDGEMEAESESSWTTKTRHRGDKRKRLQDENLSQEQITDIIGIKGKPKKNKTDKNHTQKASTSTSNQNKNIHINQNKNQSKASENIQGVNSPRNHNKLINSSAKMRDIINQPYKTLFYISANDNLTRTRISDIWDTHLPNSSDVILKTQKGFLLKSNNEKNTVIENLQKLKESNVITHFQETAAKNTSSDNTTSIPPASHSAVVGSVELDIQDTEISDFLNSININHRYCRRIVSRATGSPTRLIRIITGCINSFERLLNEGVFYKHRHYPVYPSLPPAPIPKPCSRCLQFTHTREECSTPIKCTKCNGKHHFSKCDSTLPPKCSSCGAEDHAAWSLRCPNRPTKPIEGIPNTQIKSLNKRTQEIDKKITKNSKIHSHITIHDHIINTYISKLNKEKHTNREELIGKLRKRFIMQFNIDTVATFSGSRLYILMFDLEEPLTVSPTEPIPSSVNSQIHVDT